MLYQQELVAATATVQVAAGATATADITADSEIITGDRTTIFQIGDYDGQPTGLLNADLQVSPLRIGCRPISIPSILACQAV